MILVMIDEAQDLSLIKLFRCKALAKRSMTIAADFAQKIYSTGFTWKELGLFPRQCVAEIGEKRSEIRHRSPSWQPARAETQREARGLHHASQGQVPHERRAEAHALYKRSHLMQRNAIIDLIRAIRSRAPEDTVAVLGRNGKQIGDVKKWLTDADIAFDVVDREQKGLVTTPGVKVVTYHSSKGLEFDRVIPSDGR